MMDEYPIPSPRRVVLFGGSNDVETGKWFNFFKVTPELLAEYDSRRQEQIIVKFAECEKSAHKECDMLCPQEEVPSNALLMACWLYSLDASSIQKALGKCQTNLFLERRPCKTVHSRTAEAQLSLMQGLLFFIEDNNKNGGFCLGFFKESELSLSPWTLMTLTCQ